ncbi:hypothetical protein RRG08_054274 [Elysia crispata]|uniref:G-protein coupled receptors family 3 profile domain-containing protein n=1 Tax=Elysia crispata TaxID=231223 RepID=A0AAE0XU93_9GAST|nr:hypothetical protein RRG08_054274 [Elysia crispata]
MICFHYPRLCFQLSSVIGSLGPSVVFGYKGILLIFGIFLAYETQNVRLKQVNNSRFVGMSIYNVEKERHQRNLNENTQLQKQVAEMKDRVREPNHKLREEENLHTCNLITTSKED